MARGTRSPRNDTAGPGRPTRRTRAGSRASGPETPSEPPLLTPSTLALAEQWALVPLQMRGFGHVKQANVAQAQRRSAELLHRLAPQHFARPAPADAPAAGQFKGIRITQSS